MHSVENTPTACDYEIKNTYAVKSLVCFAVKVAMPYKTSALLKPINNTFFVLFSQKKRITSEKLIAGYGHFVFVFINKKVSVRIHVLSLCFSYKIFLFSLPAIHFSFRQATGIYDVLKNVVIIFWNEKF